MDILKKDFYQRNTVEVAKDLLGKILIREYDNKILSGKIIEVEAYTNKDSACHAFNGKTERNKALFEEVGCSYIYFIYGNHYCFNVVARDNTVDAGGVLIRAIEPILGIDEMLKNRNINNLKNISDGPGKICKAFNISKDLYGNDVTKKGQIYILNNVNIPDTKIIKTPRIGIKNGLDKKWRFLLK